MKKILALLWLLVILPTPLFAYNEIKFLKLRFLRLGMTLQKHQNATTWFTFRRAQHVMTIVSHKTYLR